jgi:hypothetical protein
MNLKLYRNELIIFASFLLMLTGLFYKNSKISSGVEEMLHSKQVVKEFKELTSLQKVWANKNISKKVEKLKKIVPPSKVKWSKKGKKLTASYKSLNAKELNKLITTILSMAIQIQELQINRDDLVYNVEFKCKW